MSKPSRVIVLLEDDRHKQFVYRYLIQRGLEPHAIRILRSPSGEGSAENWVRRQFVKEVSAYRNRRVRADTALIVMIDADARSVRDRCNQLDEALQQAHKEIVTIEEQIARFVPKRNIETWILCLNGHAVTEDVDYKGQNHDWSQLIPSATSALCRWTPLNALVPDYCIDSLLAALQEARHLAF